MLPVELVSYLIRLLRARMRDALTANLMRNPLSFIRQVNPSLCPGCGTGFVWRGWWEMGMEDYHVIGLVGEGSFGKVYKGRRKYTCQVQNSVERFWLQLPEPARLIWVIVN